MSLATSTHVANDFWTSASSKRQSSTRSAFSEKIAKFVPSPYHIGPSGKATYRTPGIDSDDKVEGLKRSLADLRRGRLGEVEGAERLLELRADAVERRVGSGGDHRPDDLTRLQLGQDSRIVMPGVDHRLQSFLVESFEAAAVRFELCPRGERNLDDIGSQIRSQRCAVGHGARVDVDDPSDAIRDAIGDGVPHRAGAAVYDQYRALVGVRYGVDDCTDVSVEGDR